MQSSYFILLFSEDASLRSRITNAANEIGMSTMIDASSFVELFEMPIENNEVNTIIIDDDKGVEKAIKIYQEIRALNEQIPIIFIGSTSSVIRFKDEIKDINTNVIDKASLNETVMAFMLRSFRQLRKTMEARLTAQTELAESESLLKQSQQLAKLGHFKYYPKSERDIWSEETYRIYGYDSRKESASLQLFYSIIHPDDLNYFKEETSRRTAIREPYRIQYRLLLKDGTLKYIENSIRIHFDRQGQVEHYTGTVQDITERRLNELKIQESREKLQQVLEYLPIGAVIIEQGKLTLNKAAEKITGFSKEEISSTQQWFEKLFFKNSDMARMMYENDRNKKFPSSQVELITCKDGTQVEIERSGVLLNDTEVWLISDLSDIRTEQQLFKSMFDNASDGMLLIDNRKIVDCNKRVLELLKADSKEFIIGKEPVELSFVNQPDDKSIFEKRDEIDHMLTQSDEAITLWNHKATDGSKVPVKLHIKNLKINNRNYRLAVWHDLKAENEFKAKNEAKDRFIKKLVNHQHDVHAVLDIETLSVIFSNNQIEQLLGYTRDEFVKMGTSVFSFLVIEQDKEIIHEMQRVIHGLADNETHEFYFRSRHKNGRIVYCHSRCSIFNRRNDGTSDQFLITIRPISAAIFNISTQNKLEDTGLNILSYVPEIVYIFDLEYQTNIYANIEITSLLGYTPEEVQAMGEQVVAKLIHHEDLPRVGPHQEKVKALKDGEYAEFEYRMIHKNGNVLYFKTKEVPFHRNAKGHVSQMLGISRNVTEKVKSFARIEASESFFRGINQKIKTGVYVVDKENNVTFTNQALLKITGLTEETFKQQKWKAIIAAKDAEELDEKINKSRVENVDFEAKFSFETNESKKTFIINVSHIRQEQNYLGTLVAVDDISELLAQQNELIENANKLNSLISNAGLYIATLNRNFEFTSYNKEATEFMINNYGSEPVVGQNIFDLPSTDEIRNTIKLYIERAFSGETVHSVNNYSTLNNSVIDMTYSPIKDSSGEINEIVILSKDVTRGYQLEKLLHTYEVGFTEIFDNSPDGIFVEDALGTILAVNQKACIMQGMTRDELVGKNILELTPINMETFVADEFQRLVSGQIDTLESSMWQKGGGVLPIELKCSKITYMDQDCLLLHVRDISQRKEAEQKIKNLLHIIEEASDFIGLTSTDGKSLYRNKAFREKVGIEQDEKYTIADCYPPDILDMFKGEVIKKLEKDGYWQGESAIIDFSGERIPCSQSIIAHRNQFGEIIFYSTILRDISKTKQIEQDLRHSKHIAEETSRARELFLANMSHEIRTPLNGIVGLTDVLLQGELSEDQEEMLRVIQSSGENLIGILNEILDYAKVTSGKDKLDEKPINLRQTVDACVRLFAGKAAEKSIELKFDKTTIPSLEYVVDKIKLTQILNNLIGNAVKFTKNGFVQVDVQELDATEKGVWMQFSVTDTGIGIPSEKLETIFESFSQGKNARDFGGTGLGLSLTKAYVQMMGGKITCESRLNSGSKFSVVLLLKYRN